MELIFSVVYLVPIAIAIFTLVLAVRLVRAVERIATATETLASRDQSIR